jgi:hypothetical protein
MADIALFGPSGQKSPLTCRLGKEILPGLPLAQRRISWQVDV